MEAALGVEPPRKRVRIIRAAPPVALARGVTLARPIAAGAVVVFGADLVVAVPIAAGFASPAAAASDRRLQFLASAPAADVRRPADGGAVAAIAVGTAVSRPRACRARRQGQRQGGGRQLLHRTPPSRRAAPTLDGTRAGRVPHPP
jgi:hypothetical protein